MLPEDVWLALSCTEKLEERMREHLLVSDHSPLLKAQTDQLQCKPRGLNNYVQREALNVKLEKLYQRENWVIN